MDMVSITILGGGGEDFAGRLGCLTITAPCAIELSVSQGTVTLRARRRDARRDTFMLRLFVNKDEKHGRRCHRWNSKRRGKERRSERPPERQEQSLLRQENRGH